MDYKSLMGYGDTKKKESKPKKNKVMESIKEEFGYKDTLKEKIKDKKLQKAIDDLYKSVVKFGKHPSVRNNQKIIAGLILPINQRIVKMEKQLGEGKITEVGAAPQYKKFVKSIDKERNKVGKQTLQFVDLLRKKGLTDAADDLLDSYKNNIIKFGLEVKKIMRKII